jgi:hypothetical protein
MYIVCQQGDKSIVIPGRSGSQASFVMQCVTLTRRSFTNMMRDIGYYWLRLVMYFLISVCMGTIFWRVGNDYNAILVCNSHTSWQAQVCLREGKIFASLRFFYQIWDTGPYRSYSSISSLIQKQNLHPLLSSGHA